MTKCQELDAAIAEVTKEKTRMTQAGNTVGADQLQKKLDTYAVEKTRYGC